MALSSSTELRRLMIIRHTYSHQLSHYVDHIWIVNSHCFIMTT